MHALDTIPSPRVAHLRPTPGSGVAPEAACCILRLRTGADADALREQLAGLCRQLPGGGRAAPAIAVSVVETCGRNAADRERDALRLLDAEAHTACMATTRPTLRATLVSIAPGEHLLLLTVAPDAAMERLLARMVGELRRLHPAEAPHTS